MVLGLPAGYESFPWEAVISAGERLSLWAQNEPPQKVQNIRNLIIFGFKIKMSFMASAFSVVFTATHLTYLSPCIKPHQNTCSWAGCLTRMGKQSTSDRWEEWSWAWEAQPKSLHGTGDPLGCSQQEPQTYLCSQISSGLSVGESENHKAQLSTVSSLIACCKRQIKLYQVSRYHHDRWQRLAWSNNCISISL